MAAVNSCKEFLDPLMTQDFAGRTKDELSPAGVKRIRFRNDLHKLCFQFFLGKLAAGPQVVTNCALLYEGLNSWLVLTNPDDARYICDGTTKESRFEEAIGGRGIGFL